MAEPGTPAETKLWASQRGDYCKKMEKGSQTRFFSSALGMLGDLQLFRNSSRVLNCVKNEFGCCV